MKVDYTKFDKVINYEVGDVIVPKELSIKPILVLVKDITEKGAIVAFVDAPETDFLIINAELHLMKKHDVGSLLYGKNGQHSS